MTISAGEVADAPVTTSTAHDTTASTEGLSNQQRLEQALQACTPGEINQVLGIDLAAARDNENAWKKKCEATQKYAR